jgi:hypothetical protein
VEVSEKESGKGTDRAELNCSVPKGTLLINMALLIVLGIICKGGKDLMRGKT